MNRGWTSQDLPVVGDDDMLWTVAEAASLLGPPPNDPPNLPTAAVITKLRILVHHQRLVLGAFQPRGKRRTSPPGHPGRYARVYHATDFIGLYEMMLRGLEQPPTAA